MTMKDTLSHFLSVNQMLILIPATYFGLLFGFIYSDVTRAYVSCVQGVEMVSLTNICKLQLLQTIHLQISLLILK